MKTNRKILICIIVLILVAAIVTITMIGNKKSDIAVVRIAGLQGPTSIGMIKMIDEKPLISDVESTYEVIKTTDLLVSKLQSNEFDIACLPVNLAANIYNRGLEYQILGINTLNNLYLVGVSSNIPDIKELKGNTINVINKGATPDILFNYIMNKNGINPSKDLTLDYSMQQSELAQSLISEKVKYAVLPEPFVSQVISKNSNCKILFNLQEELNKVTDQDVDITQGCIIVNKEFANKNKKLVEEFIKKYKNSIEFVNNNTVEAGSLSEKYSLGINSSTAATAIPRSNIVFISANDSKQDVNNFLKILFDFSPNSIGNKLPDDGLFYTK